MSPARRLRPPLPLLSERTRGLTLRLPLGDAELLPRALRLTTDRAEGAATRLRGVAAELCARAARLRRIAASVDMQAEAVR